MYKSTIYIDGVKIRELEICNSSNRRQRNLPGFKSPSVFEKAIRRRALLMHTDFEILVKLDVECLT